MEVIKPNKDNDKKMFEALSEEEKKKKDELIQESNSESPLEYFTE